jgi:hypothetical protein
MAAPTSHFSQFRVKDQSPSGERHTIAASGYIKQLDISPSGEMNFGTLNNSSGIVITTPTHCTVWVVDDMGDATEEIFDMRFWLSSVADFIGLGTDYNVWFNQQTDVAWQSGLSIDKDTGTYTPTALPSSQNVNSASGLPNITGAGHDHDVSEYIYLSVSIDPDTPVGTYGGPGVGTFRYRLTYKYI